MGVKKSDFLVRLQKQLDLLVKNRKIQRIRAALGQDAELHLVGGSVRELVLCHSNTKSVKGDIDFATRLHPEELLERIKAAGLDVYSTGLEHGTVTVHIQGENFEITTFRKPGPRSVAEFSDTIEQDLAGRDFSINAIAYSLDSLGVIDPYSALDDLQNKILRAVPRAEERFLEDPLRIMRFVRFGVAAGFSPEQETFEAARQHVGLLKQVSIERVRDEFSKILISSHARQAFDQMLEIGILEVILPEILPSVDFEQNEFHSEDVYNHSLSVLARSPAYLKVRLAALFHDFGKPHTLSIGEDGRRHFYNHEQVSTEQSVEIMERMKFSKSLTRSVSKIVALHMRPMDCGPAGIRRLIRDLGEEFNDWLMLKQADSSAVLGEQQTKLEINDFLQKIVNEKERTKSPVYGKLAVNGDDLIALGLSEGKRVGEILKNLEELVIEDPNLNEKEILIKKAKVLIAQI